MSNLSFSCCNRNSKSKNEYAIKCTQCQLWNHRSCCGLTIIQLKELGKNHKWICDKCQLPESDEEDELNNTIMGPSDSSSTKQNIKSSNDDIMRKLIDMEKNYNKLWSALNKQVEENTKLRNEIESIKKQINNEADIYAEMSERVEKASNILIFGAAESTSMETKVRIEFDNSVVNQLFEKMDLQCVTPIHIHRIGVKKPNSHRPIRVKLSNSSVATKVLQNKKKLSETDPKIKADQTLKQRESFKTALSTLNAKPQPSDWIIKYIRGNPTVVKKQKTPENQEN